MKKLLQNWVELVKNIGKAYQENQDYPAIAQQGLNDLYQFPIHFKPTMSEVIRHTAEDTASYFLGSDFKTIEGDNGFALKPWQDVDFETMEIIQTPTEQIAKGVYHFIPTDTNEAKVTAEYEFATTLDDDPKIIRHISILLP